MLRSIIDLAGFRSFCERGLWKKVRRPKVSLPFGITWPPAVAWPLSIRLPGNIPRAIPRAIPWAIALVLGLGAGLSFAAFYLVLTLQKTNTAKDFEGPAQEYAISISKDLDGHLEVVKSAGAFFKASSEINRWQFFQFARDALPRHPGLRAIEWVPRVPSDQRAAYEDQAQNDGLFGFRFIQMAGEGLNGNDGRIEALPRHEHFPIYFVEPFNGNEADLGRDLATDESLLTILTRSRNSGRMLVTGLSTSATAPGPSELAILQPVYATKNVPESQAERIENLLGFVRGVLNLGNLAYSVRPAVNGLGGMDVYIFSGDKAAGGLLHYLPQSSAAARGATASYGDLTSGLHVERHHAIAGQLWTIVIAPGRNWQSEAIRLDAWLTLLLGLLLTAMLLQHLVAARNRTRAIEQAVVLRTKELRQAKEKAEEASRAKSDFLAMVGHELRTPLNAIIGFSDIMASEMFGPVGDQRYRDYVEQINASGNHLLFLINDILDLTKLEADNFDLDNDRLAMGKVVSEACKAARAKTDEAELTLTTEIEPDIPLILASRQAVRRVLDVLLSNATKFTPAGGRINVSCAVVASGGVVVEVDDDGIGIAPEAQKSIFQPFTQSDQSLSRQYEGTGLGLALALRLVELHGGTLELESQMGQGTTVRVIFPAEISLHPSAVERLARSRAG